MDYSEYEKKFLHTFQQVSFRRARLLTNNENISKCPECHGATRLDMDNGEIYCTDCGLIVKASIKYVGLKKIEYPYGILL